MFVGYPYGKKGWSMFDLETREFFLSLEMLHSLKMSSCFLKKYLQQHENEE